MKITKEIVRISIAKMEESIKILLTESILNVDEIGFQELAGQKFRQILTTRHV
jgi:nucleoside-triphosphatase THEP1